MSIRLEVVGSSGSWPTRANPSSGYLVSHATTSIVLDLGFGTMPRLGDPGSIDAVVVSHRHPDHCADVLALFHLWGYGPDRRSGIPLLGPASALTALAEFARARPGGRFHEVFAPDPVTGGSERTVGSMTLRFVAVDHSVDTVGVHVAADGAAIFYTADTGVAGEWWKTVPPCDVVLAEATWQGSGDGGDFTQHLTAEQAGSIAADIGAARLVITHVQPGLDPVRSVAEAQKAFPGAVQYAVPGLTIEV